MKNYINNNNLYLLLSILMVATLGACKKNEENLTAPPKITITSARVIDTVGIDKDTTYLLPTTLSVNTTAQVLLNYEITSEAELQQTDVKIYGVTGTAQVFNSYGAAVPVAGGYLAMRNGFQSKKADKFSLMLPGVSDKASIILQVFNEYDLTSNKTFVITTR